MRADVEVEVETARVSAGEPGLSMVGWSASGRSARPLRGYAWRVGVAVAVAVTMRCTSLLVLGSVTSCA